MRINDFKKLKALSWHLMSFDGKEIAHFNMDINPAEMRISYRKASNILKTRGGYVEIYWGDELDEFSASGKTAMFKNDQFGLEILDRKNTKAYIEFNKLLQIYMDNGMELKEDGRILKSGTLYFMFDNKKYVGYFESFKVTEVPDDPHLFNYDFNFKIIRTEHDYKVKQPNDLDIWLKNPTDYENEKYNLLAFEEPQ